MLIVPVNGIYIIKSSSLAHKLYHFWTG